MVLRRTQLCPSLQSPGGTIGYVMVRACENIFSPFKEFRQKNYPMALSGATDKGLCQLREPCTGEHDYSAGGHDEAPFRLWPAPWLMQGVFFSVRSIICRHLNYRTFQPRCQGKFRDF